MKVLMLLFLQVHRLPASHLKVTDVYAISQLLLPRLMELMSNIEEQAEAEWCPGFVRGDSLYRSWSSLKMENNWYLSSRNESR